MGWPNSAAGPAHKGSAGDPRRHSPETSKEILAEVSDGSPLAERDAASPAGGGAGARRDLPFSILEPTSRRYDFLKNNFS